jgi:hypothetical protein
VFSASISSVLFNFFFKDVEKNIGDFGKRAKAGSLSLEDMTGGIQKAIYFEQK